MLWPTDEIGFGVLHEKARPSCKDWSCVVAVGCAWAFAILRIAHSLVQATVDIVLIRLALFCLSWIALGIMLVREALAIF